ncbi:dTDP-4-dehydrorhamnose reductase [Ancylomarina longa]|uniref:dTDP-4-dehydrorhamnose reductase n=1 Tax=Ancylomarina longa TaxID=2487017 RepID=A0A434AYT7_9BACT|nr:dTDP-4-dehydrorhamnose reductase [Ancylomarina longa]RUT79635.1 dTDP-4-dehydrorhamnose reductase [Ancylomarina longa]
MINLLVTGSNGQLGREIRDLSSEYDSFHFFFTDIEELDITNKTALQSYIEGKDIRYLINCAAYTNVDQAEENEDTAQLINAVAVKNLAELASNNNIIPIHISTDYVFSGENFKPYTETDSTNPQGSYGRTKLQGEELLKETTPNHIIIRTSWLYSPFGKNFLKTMIQLGKNKTELEVIADQIGTPTYAYDLAKSILKIISHIEKDNNFKDYGTYHFSNEGVCSWYDFAQEIQLSAGNKCKISAIESKDFHCLAKRPHYSVLNKSKIKHIFDLEIPHWRTSMKHCIHRMNN